MTQLVELPPADAGLAPRRHSGPVFGYELEGRILFELDGWSRFLAVCICAPNVDVITMLEPQEIAARESLCHPSTRQHAQ